MPAALAAVPVLLVEVAGGDADCLRARYTGQLAYALNRTSDVDRGLALHLALPDGAATHPFARSRRANGIAYALFQRGEIEAALTSARLADVRGRRRPRPPARDGAADGVANW